MTISLSINRCLHQKKKHFEKREQDLLVHKLELWQPQRFGMIQVESPLLLLT